jgi:urea transporter
MISGIVVLIGIFLASLWSAIFISRRKNAIFGIIGGFIVGAISWLTASMIFYYLGS